VIEAVLQQKHRSPEPDALVNPVAFKASELGRDAAAHS